MRTIFNKWMKIANMIQHDVANTGHKIFLGLPCFQSSREFCIDMSDVCNVVKDLLDKLLASLIVVNDILAQ